MANLMTLSLFKKAFLVCSLVMTGCSTMQKTPHQAAAVSETQAIAAYSKVLKNYVNSEGAVDFNGLLKQPQDLETYVSFVAQKKFSDFTSRESLLAHHLNAYNALSMYTVIQKNIPVSNSGFSKVRFFYLTKMEIGGLTMSLVTYENDFIRSMNEDRIHWALNCMAVSCPRLPQKPFLAETLDKDLQNLAQEFFNSEKNVRIYTGDKKVEVTEILKFFPKDFVPKKAPSIIDYINLYRQDKIPTDFKTEYISYDWTINNSNRR